MSTRPPNPTSLANAIQESLEMLKLLNSEPSIDDRQQIVMGEINKVGRHLEIYMEQLRATQPPNQKTFYVALTVEGSPDLAPGEGVPSREQLLDDLCDRLTVWSAGFSVWSSDYPYACKHLEVYDNIKALQEAENNGSDPHV